MGVAVPANEQRWPVRMGKRRRTLRDPPSIARSPVQRVLIRPRLIPISSLQTLRPLRPPQLPASYQLPTGYTNSTPLSTHQLKMAIAPIVGRLRRGLVLDLSVAMGLGTSMGYLFWYGYHVPAIRQRDAFYAKIEQERIKNAQ